MEPFYFGKAPKSLFGVYHSPPTSKARNAGVVLCYPMGHEYIYAHRAILRLAMLLSSAGFHVLRFDFYGCGDSEGDYEQGGIRQWVADISTAVEELNGGCQIDRLGIIGLRLGGTLSMIAGIERGDLDCMVFWDPVISGKSYIKELLAAHHEILQFYVTNPRDRFKSPEPLEILGFPISDSLLKDLEILDLLTFQKKPANNILLIRSSEMTEDGEFKEHLKGICSRFDYQHIPAPEVWTQRGDVVGTGLVPMPVLQAVVSYISEVLA